MRAVAGPPLWKGKRLDLRAGCLNFTAPRNISPWSRLEFGSAKVVSPQRWITRYLQRGPASSALPTLYRKVRPAAETRKVRCRPSSSSSSYPLLANRLIGAPRLQAIARSTACVAGRTIVENLDEFRPAHATREPLVLAVGFTRLGAQQGRDAAVRIDQAVQDCQSVERSGRLAACERLMSGAQYQLRTLRLRARRI
jgi:hypothetical protein